MRFYVDDVHHSTIRDSDTGGFLSQQTAPMNLIINTAVGGNFLDNPVGSESFPQTLEVKHVHVYETTTGGPVLSFGTAVSRPGAGLSRNGRFSEIRSARVRTSVATFRTLRRAEGH